MNLHIYTDGGARGNPGPAAIGAVVYKNNAEIVTEISKTIGVATNNIAEYQAVVETLIWVRDYKKNVRNLPRETKLTFFLDSQLVVNQLNGIFRVKNGKLRELLLKARTLEQEINFPIVYTAIPREKNKRADFLVNKALDKLGRILL